MRGDIIGGGRCCCWKPKWCLNPVQFNNKQERKKEARILNLCSREEEGGNDGGDWRWKWWMETEEESREEGVTILK